MVESSTDERKDVARVDRPHREIDAGDELDRAMEAPLLRYAIEERLGPGLVSEHTQKKEPFLRLVAVRIRQPRQGSATPIR